MTNKEKKTSRRRIIKYNNHTGKFTNMFYSMANKKNKKENLKQKERNKERKGERKKTKKKCIASHKPRICSPGELL